jgi:hypothetical protein
MIGKRNSSLQKNMTSDMKEFEEIKIRVTLQASGRLPTDKSIEEISLLEYTKFFKNKVMLQ